MQNSPAKPTRMRGLPSFLRCIDCFYHRFQLLDIDYPERILLGRCYWSASLTWYTLRNGYKYGPLRPNVTPNIFRPISHNIRTSSYCRMSLWQPPPNPPTPLGRYRVLSPLAGVRVSPLQLGAASIGDKWAALGMGAMDKESSFKLLDAYYEAGGNFIDTSNN